MKNIKHKIFFKDARDMSEIKSNSVNLIITSPPYPMIEMWDNLLRESDKKIDGLFKKFKKAETEQKKGKIVTDIYESMHEYFKPIWEESHRVLKDGGIACINIGDATRKMNGIFRIFTNHSKITETFENIGFVSLPYILWKKPTNKPNAFLGSGFLPTNGYVTLDVEYILIFRKGGTRKFPPKDPNRYESKFTKEERDKWFSQIWKVKGETQVSKGIQRRTAAFPKEIPYRLIRMFSVKGDTILDPFLGTGTTSKAAAENNRNSIGYEIDSELKPVIENRLDPKQKELISNKETKVNLSLID